MRKFIRIFSLWILPFLVLLIISLAGFMWWCFASQAGTKWLLKTAVSQLDGQVNGIRGSLRKGLYVDNLNVDMPEVQANVFGLHLNVAWPELLKNRRLHINDISLEYLDVDIYSSDDAEPEPESSDEFSLPVLPIDIQIDNLALEGLNLNIDDEPLPVDLLSVSTSLNLDKESALLVINHLQLAKDNLLVQLNGDVVLQELAKPWPFELKLASQIQDGSTPSMLCSNTWLELNELTDQDCQLDIHANATGSLDSINLDVQADGTDLKLVADAVIFPTQAFPLGTTQVNLELPDSAGLDFKINPGDAKTDGSHLVNIDLLLNSLALNHWLPENIGESELNLQANSQVDVSGANEIRSAGLAIDFIDHNKWNGQALSGHLKIAKVLNKAGFLWPVDRPDADQSEDKPYPIDKIVIDGLDIDLVLGDSKIYAAGDLTASDSKLALNINMPRLLNVWPDVPGGLNLTSVVFGNLSALHGGLQAKYIFDDPNATEPLEAPVDLQLAFKASLSNENELHAELATLDISHAQAQLLNQNPIVLDVLADNSWQLDHTKLAINLAEENLVNIDIDKSGGQGDTWYSKGAISQFVLDVKKIEKVQQWLDTDKEDKGFITTDQTLGDDELELSLKWDLAFDQVLTGDIDLDRVRGDITVPTDIPVKLDLKEAGLNINFKPRDKASSLILADLQLETHKMGSLRLRADTPLHILPGGGFSLNESDQKNIHLQAESEDLAWINLFLGGSQEVGGTITADIKGNSRADGSWNLNGPLTGKDLSFVIPDQGVRLLDGSLAAHFDGMQLTLDKLHFPAKQRVIPKEARVAAWLTDDPDAQDGYLNVSGDVNLEKQEGQIEIDLHRYPVIQRSDRYVMLSGDLSLDLAMPLIIIVGDMTVDTGWFDIDMLSDIPELSSDVIILKRGEKMPEPEPELLDIKADINIDMGKQFYVTGFGLDTGVVGNLNIRLDGNKMRALGALRTQGGEIKAYGQELQLRRGRITFQGDISNPVLDIEALRTNVAVQAGVGITGTARAPRIGLVSYPDVSETEKLTWLLLGHGPDEGGAGDMTLLFSVGSSFLSGGEPFYKRFGIDELSMRSGQLGSTGSILPVESVVTDMDSSASPIEERFLMASKQLSKNTKLSLEQALADTGTVARLSYKLMWNLRSEITVGTTNGLALVYRWFSRD